MLIEISVNVQEMMKVNYIILFLGKGGMLQNTSFWLRLGSHARLKTSEQGLRPCSELWYLIGYDHIFTYLIADYLFCGRTQGSKPLNRAFGPVQSFEMNDSTVWCGGFAYNSKLAWEYGSFYDTEVLFECQLYALQKRKHKKRIMMDASHSRPVSACRPFCIFLNDKND